MASAQSKSSLGGQTAHGLKLEESGRTAKATYRRHENKAEGRKEFP